MKRWLKLPWHSNGDRPTIFDEDKEWKNEPPQPSSVLWDQGLSIINPDDAYWSLGAITNGLLMREPPSTNQWLGLLMELIDTDIAINTWVHYCSELRWIGLTGIDPLLAISTIQRLLDRHPLIKFTKQGTRFLAATSKFLP